MTMPQRDIVLATLNARYSHASLGLRCLHANLGAFADRAEIVEFTIQSRPLDVVEALLLRRPKLIGLGVYVWNTTETLQVVQVLRRLAPEVIVVVGGPEVSHEADDQPLCALADHVVQGEGELAFAALAAHYLGESGGEAGGDVAPARWAERPPHRVAGGLPYLQTMALPYALYSDADIANRTLYVEASRGCPYRCSFCLSALDLQVRSVPLPALFAALEALLQRGARAFKFVDRTFNLSPQTSASILQFFLDRIATTPEGLFLHFEMVPDRLPAQLRTLIAAFPPGALQLEVGIQTLDPEVAARVDRRQNVDKLFDNLAFLHRETGVHVHCDLIVGLPGEDLASFGRGFDRLVAAGPHEVQVGILKRLRGAPIIAQTGPCSMVYSPLPPYELLQSGMVTAAEMARMRRFARYWDIYANSGRFRATMPLLLGDRGPFAEFLAYSDWLWAETAQTSEISLRRACTLLLRFLLRRGDRAEASVGVALVMDFRRVAGNERVSVELAPYAAIVDAGDSATQGQGQGQRSGALRQAARQRRFLDD